jgi:hypothetical protein
MSELSYFEFAINKLGGEKGEKKIAGLGPEFQLLLEDYHKRNSQECLYQVTTFEDCQDEMRSFWSLWIQTYAESKKQALEKADRLRMGVLDGNLPPEGFLTKNGEFKEKANFNGKILRVKFRTYKSILIFQKFNLNVKIGAEVGVQVGQNAIPLLRKVPNLHLILVDNYDESLDIHRRRQSTLRKIAFERFEEVKNRITWILKSSIEAAKNVKDSSLDYVYIDAMHDYDNVKKDINAWLPKVKVGGLMLGHDYTPRYRGLKKAVREEFGKNHSNDGDVWWVQIIEGMQ